MCHALSSPTREFWQKNCYAWFGPDTGKRLGREKILTGIVKHLGSNRLREELQYALIIYTISAFQWCGRTSGAGLSILTANTMAPSLIKPDLRHSGSRNLCLLSQWYTSPIAIATGRRHWAPAGPVRLKESPWFKFRKSNWKRSCVRMCSNVRSPHTWVLSIERTSFAITCRKSKRTRAPDILRAWLYPENVWILRRRGKRILSFQQGPRRKLIWSSRTKCF